MFWHKCGGKVEDSDEFGPKCGEKIVRSGGSVATVALERPGAVTVLGWLDIVAGILGLLAAALFVLAVSAAREPAAPSVVFASCAFLALLSVTSIAAGAGLLALKPYGRTLQVVLACIGLLGFPLWTVVSILTLYYLTRPGVKLLFSGRPPQQLTSAELTEIRNVGHGPVVAAVIVLGLGILIVPVIGIVAAIAVPGLLRARQVGNESGAIGRLQTVVSAEVAYSAGNGGYYDTLDCLVAPTRCVSNAEAAFLPREVVANGAYAGHLYPGEAAPRPEGGSPAISASSMRSFAYVLVPATVGAGTRAFCADETGVIRVRTILPPEAVGERLPDAMFAGGHCPEDWPVLRR